MFVLAKVLLIVLWAEVEANPDVLKASFSFLQNLTRFVTPSEEFTSLVKTFLGKSKERSESSILMQTATWCEHDLQLQSAHRPKRNFIIHLLSYLCYSRFLPEVLEKISMELVYIMSEFKFSFSLLSLSLRRKFIHSKSFRVGFLCYPLLALAQCFPSRWLLFAQSLI